MLYGLLAVNDANIESLNAEKIQTGQFRVNQAGNGASEIMIDAPAAIRLETNPATPAEIIFQTGAGVAQAKISGKGGELDISPTGNDTYALQIGEPGLNGDDRPALCSQHHSYICRHGRQWYDLCRREARTDALESTLPPGATPNRRLPLYNIAGSLIGYIWVSI